MTEPLDTVISLGAGVQSSALALMLANGDLDLNGVDSRTILKRKAGNRLLVHDGALNHPRLAIFADTGWEPAEVYEHLDRLEVALRIAPHPIEVARVSAGNIRDDVEARVNGRHSRYANLPVYLKGTGNAGTTDRRGGILRRQCTREYKLDPLMAELRRRGYGPNNHVASLVGISLDELRRVKPGAGWQHRAHPLIDRRLARVDCAAYLAREGWTAPRSACIGCPYHSDTEWRRLRDTAPDEWADAVDFDELIRTALPGLRGEAFLHRQRIPLADVDLATREDHGQGNLFDDECEGVCGV